MKGKTHLFNEIRYDLKGLWRSPFNLKIQFHLEVLFAKNLILSKLNKNANFMKT